ncbi:hypothetical protein Tco_0889052 [Tanacetum coccineum]
MRDFLWNYGEFKRGKTKINWFDVCKPKVEGGLGRSFWDVHVNQGASWAWKKILSDKVNLKIHILHRIGDGSDTSVWFDIWSSMCPLSDFIPNRAIYNAGVNLNTKSLIRFVMANGDDQQKPVLKKLDTLVTWNYLKLHYPNSSPRILHLEVLVGETSGPVKLEETRRFVLRDDLECKMAASDTPFTTLYTILHEFCVPLIMDTIIRQIQALRIGRWKDAIRFELISDGNQGQGSSASSVQTSQDGEADFVSLRTPGDKILYWLESEKNSRTLNAVSCPFIKIEPGSDLQIKCLNSSFVIDPLTNREAELSIDLELGENSHIRRAEGDVLLHTGLNEPGSEYNKICRVEDILVEGLIQGSVVHFHRAGTVIVPLTGIVSTSRMGCTGGVGRGHLLSNRIGSGGGYGGTAGHGCYNDTCIEGGLPYGDAELPCQLGSGGGNDSTVGGGVLVIRSLEHPISSVFVDRSLTANGRSYVEGTASNLYDLYNSDGGGLGGGLAE